MNLIPMQRSIFRVQGEGACDFLQSVCTNDIKSLKDGRGIGAAFLDRFGKVLCVAGIYRFGGDFIIEADAAARDNLAKCLSSATRLDRCSFFNLVNTHRLFSSCWIPERGAIMEGEFQGQKTIEMTGCFIDRADFLVPEGVAGDFWKLAYEKGSVDEYDKFRIESGMPEFGRDYDSTCMVLELGIDNIISYEKGCYTGQEIVARMRAYGGEVPKKIVKVSGNASEGKLMKDGMEAGRITSAAGGFGIAVIKKGFYDKGTELVTENGQKVIVG